MTSGRTAAPLGGEGEDLVGGRALAVDQDGVGARRAVRLGPAEGLVEPAPRDERLHARDDREVRIAGAVLAGLDLAAELVDLGQRLVLADERVGLREELVLEADGGDAPLAELPDQAAHVVEVAVAGVAVEKDRDRRGVGHELEHLQDLRPGGLVAVADAERGRDREARRPDSREARFLDDLRREAVVSLHEEGELGRVEQRPEPRRPRHRGASWRARAERWGRHGRFPLPRRLARPGHAPGSRVRIHRARVLGPERSAADRSGGPRGTGPPVRRGPRYCLVATGPAEAVTVWMNPCATCGTGSCVPSRISWTV